LNNALVVPAAGAVEGQLSAGKPGHVHVEIQVAAESHVAAVKSTTTENTHTLGLFQSNGVHSMQVNCDAAAG
jgi:hypothetical protein